MDVAQINIFGLPQPESLTCTVWMYRVQLPVLLIRVHKVEAEKSLWLFFENPTYFDGPLQWRGASFGIGAQEEKRKLGQVLYDEQPSGFFFERTNLYVVERVKADLTSAHPQRIKILATGVQVSTKQYSIGDFFT